MLAYSTYPESRSDHSANEVDQHRNTHWPTLRPSHLGHRLRGRKTFVAENYDNFTDSEPPGGIGGGSDHDEDRVVGWTYDGLGQVTALTAYNASLSTSDQVTQYEYKDDHDASLVTKTIYPRDSNDTVDRSFNLDGTLATMTDQRGVIHFYYYDGRRQLEADRVVSFGSNGSSIDQNIQTITRQFDALGRVVKITSHRDSTDNPLDTSDVENQIEFQYSSLGTLIKSKQSHEDVVNGQTPVIQYFYDASTDSTVYNDGLREWKVEYPSLVAAGVAQPAMIINGFAAPESTNDRLNRVRYRTLWSGGFLSGDEQVTSYYQYNGHSRLSEIEVHKGSLVVEREMFSSAGVYSAWDRFGRTEESYWKNAGGTQLDQFNYTYDYAGNRLTRNQGLDNTYDQTFDYDGLHRLLSVDESTSGMERAWKLDQLGNWEATYSNLAKTNVETARTHNDANELTGFTSGGWTTPTYDAAGNMTALPKPETPAAAYTAVYDAWDRLAVVKDNQTVVQVNEYDGLNRRIVKSDGTSTAKHYYYNSRWQVLVEASDTTAGSAEAMYMYHPHYVDAIGVRVRETDAHIYLQDDNFNVTAVTDITGNVVERYNYSPYGEVTVLHGATDAESGVEWAEDVNGTDIGNELLYTGRRLDLETGLQLNRNRFYHQQLGRWVTRDPINYFSSNFNLYGYVNNAPTYNTDPSGLVEPQPGLVVGYFEDAITGAAFMHSQVHQAAAEGRRRALERGGIPDYVFGVGLSYVGEGFAHFGLGVAEGVSVGLVGKLAKPRPRPRFGKPCPDVKTPRLVDAASTGEGSVVPNKPSGFEPYGVNPLAGTRVRPEGIPDGWRIRPTRGRGGVEYYNPRNPNESVRVMQGNPNSPYPNSQGPYVRQRDAAGTYLRPDGTPSPLPNGGLRDPDTHIPIDNYPGFLNGGD